MTSFFARGVLAGLIKQEAAEVTEKISLFSPSGLLSKGPSHASLVLAGRSREEPLRFDLLIDQCLFVEVKAVDTVRPIRKAQLLSYMKLLDIPLGLVINFNSLRLTEGVSRLILPGANDQ